jgi:protocatechuate 3,4-dioxygenase beta subunit
MSNRRDFLKTSGLLGAVTFLPLSNLLGNTKAPLPYGGCTLIPSETAGPFPLDLTANTEFFRTDITDGQTGVPLTVRLRIIGSSNCEPMQNVRVNIWHCSRLGVYSGYNTNNNPGDVNAIHLRGYQFTDSNGEVEFQTIFPGWYSGRICHIHFQVYVSTSYSAVSQLTFPLEEKNALYAANTSLYPNGADPLTFSTDNIFSDGYALQLATLTANDSGGYDSFMEVTVQGTGTVGVGHIEKQTAKQFTMGQNFPNPYIGETTIPFVLQNASDVQLNLFDINGRKVHTLTQKGMISGSHQIKLDMNALQLSSANYAYQLTIENENGKYTDTKLMSAKK